MADTLVHGLSVPDDLLGQLVDSTPLLDDGPQLRTRFDRDGYAYFRGALDAALVRAARQEVLDRLVDVGEIEPASDGRFTGRSERDVLHPDRGEFWRSVSAGPRLRRLTQGDGVRRLVELLIDDEVVPLDYVMLRVAVPGRATEVHYDYPFFARLHDQVRTVWIPVGDVPVERGPLFIVEGSNRFDDIIAGMLDFEVTGESSRTAAFTQTAIDIAEQRSTRLLTTDFTAGDVLIFGMYTAHGSLDHHDDSGTVRISCDARWQAKRLELDDRYMGTHPGGTTGAGYGELNGAKPLTEQWHVR